MGSNGGDIMRVIPTACPDTNAALLDAFRHHLADRDLAPATVHAYLSDLTRFQAWLTWVHEDQAPLLTQVRTVDLAARSEAHTTELQSPYDLVCRLLLE